LEDRRCRKVMALLMTTVIILSVFVQNAYAAPEKSTDKLLNRVINFKQTFLADVKTFITQVSAIREKELANQESTDNEIVFVIEQIPLEKVLGSQSQKAQNSGAKAGAQSQTENKKVNNNEKANTSQNKTAVKTATASRSTGKDILREDLELLARVIHAEARGESFEGQVAVGAVVLNRVQHPDFPKSIKDVVYQPGQFTAVEDRQIELKPNDKAYQAAQAALEGQDPSNGAIYYYNPKIATDPWIKTRNIIRSIGNHKFCV